LTEAGVSSSWPDPSFTGAYLPLNRDLGPKGFQASWRIPELARSFPSAWVDHGADLSDIRSSALGVGLVKTVSTYQQASRATKYAILFILLTFTAFFLFEVFNRLRVHPIQYLLVGAALVVFYLLLLSLSEHLGFDGAYALATAMTLVPVSVYVRGVLRERSRVRVLLGLLLGLYAYLYIILRLSDYALLMGSLAIFAALSTAMILTRNVDWSRLEPGERA
jgi:inner membrane protein